jgi:hypothetical protein
MDPSILLVLSRFLPIFWTICSKITNSRDLLALAKGTVTGFKALKFSGFLTEKSISVLEGGLSKNYKGSSYLGILESIWA